MHGSDPFFSNGLDPSVTDCQPGKRQDPNPEFFLPWVEYGSIFFSSSQCSDLHPVNNIPDLCIYLLKKKKKKKYLCYISIFHLEVLNQNEKVELSFKIKLGTGVRLLQM